MPGGKVMIVEDDPVLGDLVHALLIDEGYTAWVVGAVVLGRVEPGALQPAVARLEPDCVLLDGGGPDESPAGRPAVGREYSVTHGRPRRLRMASDSYGNA